MIPPDATPAPHPDGGLDAPAPGIADYVVTGDLHLTKEGGIDGWVWSPDRPDEPLVAEILFDDTQVAAIVAVLPRGDLAGRDIGDGRHGFSFRPPPGTISANTPVVITARERGTGRIFARIVRHGPAIAPADQAAIDGATAQVEALWTGLAAMRPLVSGPGRAARLRAAFNGLSGRLAAGARGGPVGAGIEIAAAHEQLRRRCGTLILPLLGTPALTVVLPVGADAALTLGHLRALSPALADIGVEVVLVDQGIDPRGALIPALAANVVYLRAAARATAHATAEALRAARGEGVALLEPGPAPPSGTALAALATLAAAAPRKVLLGPAAIAAAARVGCLQQVTEAHCAPAPLGLVLALGRDMLHAAGGLDPAMSDGDGLDFADLWLRCRLLDAQAVAWTEPPRAPAPPVASAAEALQEAVAIDATDPQAALHALAAFGDRWQSASDEVAHA